ncbi:MAG: carboxymuconolactone decarboxylase family protein [Pedobacter sp.]
MKTSIFQVLITLTVSLFSFTNMNAQDNNNNNVALDAKQQSIVAISALTAKGDIPQLKSALDIGLNSGLTINEIKELLVQMYAYCGFPRSLNGINTFMNVIQERKAKGISDKQGKEATPIKNNFDKYEQGKKVLETLSKTPQLKPAAGFGKFAPRIDAFLKEHLFGDVFESDVLTFQQRELATISALSAMTGVESQLQSHLSMGKNTGLVESQLVQVSELIENYIGKIQANTLRKLLSKPTVRVIEKDMMVRISEIEIVPEYLDEYIGILKEEAASSVKIEPGVIAIFPMYQKENPTQIRIVEMYANKAAYQSHLQTPHFQLYKTATLKMVKSLKLIDMASIDEETMLEIFKKIE